MMNEIAQEALTLKVNRAGECDIAFEWYIPMFFWRLPKNYEGDMRLEITLKELLWPQVQAQAIAVEGELKITIVLFKRKACRGHRDRNAVCKAGFEEHFRGNALGAGNFSRGSIEAVVKMGSFYHVTAQINEQKGVFIVGIKVTF